MMAEALLWIVLCAAIFASARYWEKTRSFWEGMKKHMKASLAIALIYVLGFLLAGMGMDPLGALITTASGLVVAIPTFVLYRYLANKADALIVEMEEHSIRMVDLLKGRSA